MGLLNRAPQATDLQKYILVQDWETAKKHLEYHPKEAKQWIKITLESGRSTEGLPLHLALSGYAPIDFIKALIEAYPKALLKEDVEYKRLPLHYACLHTPYPELIELLLKHNRDATFKADFDGRMPLHYAAFGCAHEYVFKQLLDINPKAAEKQDEQGWLPLHIAVRYNCSHGAIESLANAYPQALKEKTKKGKQLPKDIAQKFHIQLDEKTSELFDSSFRELRRRSSRLSDCPSPELLEIHGEAV